MNVKSPSRLTRAESKARTRARLLEAGERVFAAQGFHETTVEDVATAAGFTRGAFYANFTDKADLLLTVLDEQSRAGLDELAERMEFTPGGHGLDALMAWFVQRFAAPSPLDRAVGEFMPIAINEERVARRLRDRFTRVRDQVATLVTTQCERADFTLPIPADRFATMVIAVVDGLAMLHRLDPAAAPAELLGDTLRCLGEGAAARGGTGA